jgi:hypothetical protein
MSVNNFSPQLTAEQIERVIQIHQLQDSVETKGPKCNTCAYDIVWDKPRAEQEFGSNKPYEADKILRHFCIKDDAGNPILRKGYEINTVTGKAVCVIPGALNAGQTKLGSGTTNNTTTMAMNAESIQTITKQIDDIKQEVKTLTVQLNTFAANQTRILDSMVSVVTQFVEHNPMTEPIGTLVETLIKYLPEPELKPKTADELL